MSASHFADGRPNGWGQRISVTGRGPHQHEDIADRILRERHVNLHELLGLVGATLDLTGDAHHFTNHWRLARRTDLNRDARTNGR